MQGLGQPKPAEADLKKRTPTNFYNQRPAWLDNAHKKLDAVVLAAYGWPETLSEEDLGTHLPAVTDPAVS